MTMLDDSQRQIVEIRSAYNLVLAPPGCGKTHLLAERIAWLMGKGVDAGDVLCLTFTNRAAREMQQRIRQKLQNDVNGQRVDEDLYIGNIHRFCSKYLFEEKLVEADTVIIDDDEAFSIVADQRNEDETLALCDRNRATAYRQVVFFSHLMEQISFRHDKSLYLHGEALTDNDLQALKWLASRGRWERGKFSSLRELMLCVYDNPQLYYDDADGWPLDQGSKLRELLHKMELAKGYSEYKQQHSMLDFEDLLIHTYQQLLTNDNHRRYGWIQVDEVQDLNALQMAIVDQLEAKEEATVLYLGDEQQAIFSFMGAKMEMLDKLKNRCEGNIFHLTRNHRSPGYLLDVLNTYAEKQLHIDSRLLPNTDSRQQAQRGDLIMIGSNTEAGEARDVAMMAARLQHSHPDETTAVIVSSNLEADNISKEMLANGLSHFKVSGSDMFSSPEIKMVLAHLTVLDNDLNQLAWTRLLKGMKVFPTYTLARRFVYKMRSLAMSPSDLLCYDRSTYVCGFVNAYENSDIVVFDTETTGTNPFANDVIEIAAMRLRSGVAVADPLDLYVSTAQPIPEKLGEKVNPMCEIYAEKEQHGALLSVDEAMERFAEYIDGAVVVGHNVMFDVQIIRCNSRNEKFFDGSTVIDTLKLSRLLFPRMVSYTLETLIATFGLVGENSHRAIDDVKATVSLLSYCYQKAKTMTDLQMAFINHPKVLLYINKVRAGYKDLFIEGCRRLYQARTSSLSGSADAGEAVSEPLLAELERAYNAMIAAKQIAVNSKMGYLLEYLRRDILVDTDGLPTLQMQLGSYLMELLTMKEADFCNSRSMNEKVYVTTVHKAKGLEFDNVIVFDVVNGRYPSWRNQSLASDSEDARKLYVAMSRAKRRLAIAYSLESKDRYGHIRHREISPFMQDILPFFSS